MKNFRFASLAFATALMIPVAAIAAGVFSDVPDNHPYKGEIEAMARSGVIKGNPDGSFAPNRTINRAELLKLLYAASGKQPKPINVACFSDVEQGSWYEQYVCDAAAPENRFVQGYSDGKFRPASPVTRTEGLKMLITVFGLPVTDVSSLDRDLIKFVDVSVAAWYTKYLSAAYQLKILPIAGQEGARFYPDKELTRGEAAAYIYNAQKSTGKLPGQSSSASSTASSTPALTSSSSSSSSVSTSTEKNVAFPFSETSKFSAKKPVSYLFSLSAAKTVLTVNTTIVGFYPSDVTCRLYLIGEDGFSSEYYLGVQGPNSCMITAAVPAGSYQLQLQPVVGDVAYNVDVKTTAGDGNDGFLEAIILKKGRAMTDMLVANDLYDWFRFVPAGTTPQTVSLTASDKLTCIIYTPPSVDQYGFSGPECGTPYSYQPGATYMIGISRSGGDFATKSPYTLLWQ
ncbi:MAG: S-layer homology domain-containing protein [Candidatus Peribacteraceae bacterium]|nr:S-layer homology domain-containing protein [Candidatus Peribacteraceae bacterium]